MSLAPYNNINLVPDIYPSIAQYLPAKDVINFASTCSKNFENMNQEPVWAVLAKRDFSDLLKLGEKPKDVSWKDYYKFCNHLNSSDYAIYESSTKAFQAVYTTLPKAGLKIDKGLIIAGSLTCTPIVYSLSALTHLAIYSFSLICFYRMSKYVNETASTYATIPLPIWIGILIGGGIAISIGSVTLADKENVTRAILDKLMPPTRSISFIFHRVFSNHYVRTTISHTSAAINALKTRLFSRRA